LLFQLCTAAVHRLAKHLDFTRVRAQHPRSIGSSCFFRRRFRRSAHNAADGNLNEIGPSVKSEKECVTKLRFNACIYASSPVKKSYNSKISLRLNPHCAAKSAACLRCASSCRRFSSRIKSVLRGATKLPLPATV
jgi:hypothetical protein